MRDMSETNNTGETIELGENYNPPTMQELQKRMAVLEQRGVTAELRCGDCGELTDTTILPEERDRPDPIGKTLCRSCTVAFLQKQEVL